jgi:hypothetical protein
MTMTYSSKGERLQITWKYVETEKKLTSKPRNNIQNTVSPWKKRRGEEWINDGPQSRATYPRHNSVLTLSYLSHK